jgi:hypothetical protein
MPESPDAQIIKKVRKLSEIAEALRQGNKFHVTRLTIIKSLCAEPEAATAFALFLAQDVKDMQRKCGSAHDPADASSASNCRFFLFLPATCARNNLPSTAT